MYGLIAFILALLCAQTEEGRSLWSPRSSFGESSSLSTGSFGPSSDATFEEEAGKPEEQFERIDENTYLKHVSNDTYLVMKRIDGLNYLHWRRYAEAQKLIWLEKIMAQGLLTETWVVYLISGDPRFKKEIKLTEKTCVEQAQVPKRLISVGMCVNFPRQGLAVVLLPDNENAEIMYDTALLLLRQRMPLKNSWEEDDGIIDDSAGKSDAMFFKCCSIIDALRLKGELAGAVCRIFRIDRFPQSSFPVKTVDRLRRNVLMARAHSL